MHVLCIHCIITLRIFSIKLTETASTPPLPLLFQNRQTLQFGIYTFQYEIFTKYALVKSLCLSVYIVSSLLVLFSNSYREYRSVTFHTFIPKWTNYPIRNIDKVRIIAMSLYTLYHNFWKLVLNPLRECRFSTLSTIIPKWTNVPIWNVGFPMKNIDIVRICVISLYTLCHRFRFNL